MTIAGTADAASRSRPDGTAPTVVVIGGGFTGAAIAWHLGFAAGQRPAVTVFEPRRLLGGGLAYDTADPVHRINVPAAKMSLVPSDEDHFLRWLRASGLADPEALRPDGSLFPRREIFGRYVAAHLAPLLQSGAVTQVAERVVKVSRVDGRDDGRHDGRWRVTGDGGSVVFADVVVIATSHPPPAAPAPLAAALHDHPRFVADPTRPGALAAIRPDDRVLVVGNGLTAADIIASLGARGHRGPIVAVSRRGLRSRGHAARPAEPRGDFVTAPSTSARALLARVRAEVAQADAAGSSWHAVFDALRLQGGAVWAALPLAERRRLVRHLRPFWDVHRFRVAPQVEDAIVAGLTTGRLEIAAAHVTGARVAGEAIRVDLRRRGDRAAAAHVFDAVVVTTGPAHRGILAAQPYLADLERQGLVRLDDVGLGLACDAHGRAVGRGGTSPTLLVAGPLARGTFGELMGLPQVADYALFIASEARIALGLGKRDAA
ncbi:FAD/NAD(P)-binding protein [Methylobrevis albus]|uniref:FAD-dependent oxidoreductase n=1 Tax=Methylobrevis albus TaxID=2793297 RepID=A0A931I323_9HYPH|nr:FAD-dependent oxidoreductase [Methylobrevis albus]MBH0238932.1 FAD-dependent oxidoreductase [Methylobrevis albus]